MNEDIITKILSEYDIKNPSKQVKSAIQEFAFKYAQKLLLKTHEVANNDKVTETHVRCLSSNCRVAYDLLHNIHTPEYELAQEKDTKDFISKLNASENELRVEGEVLSNLAVM